MSIIMFHIRNLKRSSRAAIRWNLGGHEQNTLISGNHNSMGTMNPLDTNDETLLRKIGHQFGRVFEGSTDLVLSPAKWLSHMQDNW